MDPSKRPRDHWQDEKDRLIAELEKKILGRREQITIQEISAVPMPELLLAAFRNHARGILKRERPLVLQSAHRFILDDGEIKTHLRRLRELLLDRLVMPRDEVIEVIVFAVKLQFDVMTKPRTALVSLLYERALERERDDVATIITGLGEQRPMIAALLNLIGDYPPGPVNREAFVALCRRAEKMAYGEKPVSALLADLSDYMAFCSGIVGTPVAEIDNQTVLGILFERNLKEMAEGLLPILTQKDKWALPEVEKVFEHQIVSSGLSLAADGPGQLFPPPEINPGEFFNESDSEDDRRSGKNGQGSKTVDEMTENRNDRSPVPKAVAVEWGYDIFADAADTDTSAISAEAPGSQKTGRHRQADFQIPLLSQPLHRLIDEKSRAVFIKKIFKKDAAAYERFVDTLEIAETWKAAKEILDEELSRRKINSFSKEAVRFGDLVFSRYFPRR
jgi:hypothetical protein